MSFLFTGVFCNDLVAFVVVEGVLAFMLFMGVWDFGLRGGVLFLGLLTGLLCLLVAVASSQEAAPPAQAALSSASNQPSCEPSHLQALVLFDW